ncbi:MAG: MarR family transcriptional regulator [Pseudoruegeria sp.]
MTARIVEKRFEDRIKRLGLTRLYWCILLACNFENLTYPSDIARFIGVDRTAISRALKQMEANGFIERETGQSDRRTTTVKITKHGAELTEKSAEIARENSAYFLGKLGEEDCTELKHLLLKLRTGEKRDLPGL